MQEVTDEMTLNMKT